MTSNTYNIDYLKNVNKHERDSNINFYEPTHTYTILNDTNSKYTSVTTWIHTLFEKFDADKIIQNMMRSKNWQLGHKYYGLTPQEIKNIWDENRNLAASMGTQLHYLIECFMNLGQFIDSPSNFHYPTTDFNLGHLLEYYNNNTECLDKCKKDDFIVDNEFKYFLNFAEKFPNLIPYRTEWTVYDEDLKFSGSIDMLFKDENGKFHIYDWKRSKEIVKTKSWLTFSTNEKISHIPDTNFWHYSLQLNTYKRILKKKYNMDIETMYLVCIHPENKNNNFILYKVTELQDELNTLFS